MFTRTGGPLATNPPHNHCRAELEKCGDSAAGLASRDSRHDPLT